MSYLLRPKTSGEGNILFLVWIPLASVSASVLGLALASHFLVCSISCEPVVGFLPNLHDNNWDITKN